MIIFDDYAFLFPRGGRNHNKDIIQEFFEKMQRDKAKQQDTEELYYDVQESLVVTKQHCRRSLQQGINNKIFPIETIDFEMV